MKELLKLVKKQLTKDYGKPCKDFTPLCPNCLIWRAFFDIESMYKVLED